MKLYKLFLLIVLSFGVLTAQNSNRLLKDVKRTGDVVRIEVSDGYYLIKPYSNYIVETSFIPRNETFNPFSDAVVLEPNVEFSMISDSIETIITTEGVSVIVTHSPFQISYFYKEKYLISERFGFADGETDILDFNLTENEILYGGGARALGMNRRGYRLQLYNRAHYGYETHSELMNFTIPLIYSSKMYGIHFDNAPIGYLDLDSDKDNSLVYETIGGRKTYQIIAGETWDNLVENYVKLTGLQPLIPRWALGNFSSRFGYHSQVETVETIKKFQEEEIPVDAVILDLYWFGKTVKGTMGNFEFDKDSFPDPKKMIADLKSKNVKTVLISEPFILTTSNRWDEAVQEDILGKNKEGEPYTYDFYFGNTGIIDIFKPEGKDWFKNIYKKFTDYGVAGWWGDLGEPEVHPSDLLHHTGTADEVHNIYGHYWAKLVDEMYLENFPNERPFILMRAGYSGSQHYGMIPWSGDVNRTWGGLQSQVEIALQMGMQGLTYMHSDLGGFAGANLDDELYTRWLQYGVFQPIYRPHAQEDVPSEPVFRADKAKALAKKAIELRYQLLPYNYNLSFKNSQLGTPLMRPLFFEEKNESFLTNNKTYLWGDNFLVSPVVEAGLDKQLVDFPIASNWYNFYTDEKIKGGQTINTKLSADRIPTYVRGGSFIPMIQPIQNTGSYSLNSFDLHFYYDNTVKESKYDLYNDDGETRNSFEKGMYELLKFNTEVTGSLLNINFESETGENYKTSTKQINLIIHNVNKLPKKLKINGKRVRSLNYNSENKTLTIQVNWATSERKELTIKLKK